MGKVKAKELERLEVLQQELEAMDKMLEHTREQMKQLVKQAKHIVIVKSALKPAINILMQKVNKVQREDKP